MNMMSMKNSLWKGELGLENARQGDRVTIPFRIDNRSKFEEKEFDTLNGLLISKLNRIPEEDEDFEIGLSGYSFRIQEVENKTIQWVFVERLKEEGEEDSPLPAKEPLAKKKG